MLAWYGILRIPNVVWCGLVGAVWFGVVCWVGLVGLVGVAWFGEVCPVWYVVFCVSPGRNLALCMNLPRLGSTDPLANLSNLFLLWCEHQSTIFSFRNGIDPNMFVCERTNKMVWFCVLWCGVVWFGFIRSHFGSSHFGSSHKTSLKGLVL